MAAKTEELSIGFIGAGKMATAIASGMVDVGLLKSGEWWASSPGGAEALVALGSGAASSNVEVVKQSDVVILAVKPQMLTAPGGVMEELSAALQETEHNPLIVSIAAGVTLATLEARLADGSRVVRVMPNTPSLCGRGTAAVCAGSAATGADTALVSRLFGAVGEAYVIEEKLMDAFTGLAGSGPAYVYMFVEALADGGVAAGLPRPLATELAARTVEGGAAMVLETGRHPGELKDEVCSPAGATIEAVRELERAGFRHACIEAVLASYKRCIALG